MTLTHVLIHFTESCPSPRRAQTTITMRTTIRNLRRHLHYHHLHRPHLGPLWRSRHEMRMADRTADRHRVTVSTTKLLDNLQSFALLVNHFESFNFSSSQVFGERQSGWWHAGRVEERADTFPRTPTQFGHREDARDFHSANVVAGWSWDVARRKGFQWENREEAEGADGQRVVRAETKHLRGILRTWRGQATGESNHDPKKRFWGKILKFILFQNLKCFQLFAVQNRQIIGTLGDPRQSTTEKRESIARELLIINLINKLQQSCHVTSWSLQKYSQEFFKYYQAPHITRGTADFKNNIFLSSL